MKKYININKKLSASVLFSVVVSFFILIPITARAEAMATLQPLFITSTSAIIRMVSPLLNVFNTTTHYYYIDFREKTYFNSELWTRIDMGSLNIFTGDHRMLMDNLNPDTEYEYRAMSISDTGSERYGSTITFKTLESETTGTSTLNTGQMWGIEEDPSDFFLETKDATEITDSSAVLNGEGLADTVRRPPLQATAYFRYTNVSDKPPLYCNDIYGTNMQSTEDQNLGNGIGLDNRPVSPKTFSTKITGLTPNTTYYYCAIISDEKSIGYGGEKMVKSFRTLPCQTCDQTTITTGQARQIFHDSAYLSGDFSSTKRVTTYFQYRAKPRINLFEVLANLNDGESLTSTWKSTGKITHSASRNQAYGGIFKTLKDLKPETRYEFRAVAENMASEFSWDETAWQGLVGRKCPENMTFVEETNVCVVYGETKAFVTKSAPINVDYCDRNPNDPICDPTTIDPNLGPQYPDLVAGFISPYFSIINKLTTFVSTISNIGGLRAGSGELFQNIQIDGPVSGGSQIGTLIHKFEINDSNETSVDESTEVVYVTGPGIAANGEDEIETSKSFSSAGLKKIRACAAVDERDPDLGNNCGPWTTVAIVCEAPQFYDTQQNTCVTPIVCGDGEIFDWNTRTCIPQTICVDGEVYNPFTNTCIPTPDCNENQESTFCDPGPGWFGGGGGWTGGGWSGGNWTGGGWIGGSWYGGTWTGTGLYGNTWSGGIWQNGIWNGGGWSDGNGNLTLGQSATPPWDAIVRSQEGVEHVFARQIINNIGLQKKYGYQSGTNLETFAWDIAHLLAQIFGYVDPSGKEIRVSYPDIAAYELRLSGNTLTVYEYYSGIIVSIQNTSTNIKTKAGYEYYFNK